MAPIPSPLQTLHRLGRLLGIDLRAKRDDLLPFTGGGNKARKFEAIAREIERSGCDAVVTTGGTQSNHARVAALVAAERGWSCSLVLHGDPRSLERPEGNLLLMKLAGASIEIVSPEGIAPAMRQEMERLAAGGRQPFEVAGGGHGRPGSSAYLEAVREVADQCGEDEWIPDWILTASGTGATQAGIAAGIQAVEWETRLVGVSVARSEAKGRAAVLGAYQDLCAGEGLRAREGAIDFRDRWVGEGYGHPTPAGLDAVRLAALHGLVLDPTYTGKTFAALLDLVHDGSIRRGARVLFWHTGGLLNLMASFSSFIEGGESAGKARDE